MNNVFSQVRIDSITKINDDLIYSAKDSIVYDVNENQVLLFNEAKLIYKNIQLDSGFMLINSELQISKFLFYEILLVVLIVIVHS